eukprot:TRINITY_DN7978_c0_g1_i2.p1 TRINITY_DN7978_c0_g1~~TRINITY_DN7978_c0_g1_i2.p1  ORF type:complete len:961 (-),score=248.60 TRINITY_DN7978_c0_g1_i2:240-3122(-)
MATRSASVGTLSRRPNIAPSHTPSATASTHSANPSMLSYKHTQLSSRRTSITTPTPPTESSNETILSQSNSTNTTNSNTNTKPSNPSTHVTFISPNTTHQTSQSNSSKANTSRIRSATPPMNSSDPLLSSLPTQSNTKPSSSSDSPSITHSASLTTSANQQQTSRGDKSQPVIKTSNSKSSHTQPQTLLSARHQRSASPRNPTSSTTSSSSTNTQSMQQIITLHVSKITQLETQLHEHAHHVSDLEKRCETLSNEKDTLESQVQHYRNQLDSLTEDNIRLQSLYDKMCNMYDQEIQKLHDALQIIESQSQAANTTSSLGSPTTDPQQDFSSANNPTPTTDESISNSNPNSGNPSSQVKRGKQSVQIDPKPKQFIVQKVTQDRRIFELEKTVTELQRKVYDQQRNLSERTRQYKSRFRQMKNEYEIQLQELNQQLQSISSDYPPTSRKAEMNLQDESSINEGLPHSASEPSLQRSNGTEETVQRPSSQRPSSREGKSLVPMQTSGKRSLPASSHGTPSANQQINQQSTSTTTDSQQNSSALKPTMNPPPRFKFSMASAAAANSGSKATSKIHRERNGTVNRNTSKAATKVISEVIENIGVEELEKQIQELEQTQVKTKKEQVRVAQESSILQSTLKAISASVSQMLEQVTTFCADIARSVGLEKPDNHLSPFTIFSQGLTNFTKSLGELALLVDSNMSDFTAWARKSNPSALSSTWLGINPTLLPAKILKAEEAVSFVPKSLASLDRLVKESQQISPVINSGNPTKPQSISHSTLPLASVKAIVPTNSSSPPPPPPPPPPLLMKSSTVSVDAAAQRPMLGVLQDLGSVQLRPTQKSQDEAARVDVGDASVPLQSKLMSEMLAKGNQLRSVNPNEHHHTKALVPSTPMGMLLEEIRQGVQLRKITPEEPREHNVRKSLNFMKSFASMIKEALAIRKTSLMQSDESDYASSGDSGDWLDPADE